MDETEGSVFFSRCRPQEADPIDLALRERRIFMGWPAWRPNIQPRRGHLRKCIVDLRCTDDEWSALYPMFDRSHRKNYQQNRNFIREIKCGSIGLIPRPKRGVIYAGRVKTTFELLDDPPWGNEYLGLRSDQGLSVEKPCSHLADVAHCCQVDRFIPIPYPLVPAWIRRSLFGRSTYGRIWPSPDLVELGLEPYSAMDRLLTKPERRGLRWTMNMGEVERRLLDSVGPHVFEHLCVALLQLENPRHVWMQVGGNGDGGVDGVGASTNGKVVGLLQCKWAYGGEVVKVADSNSNGKVQQVLAALIHTKDVRPPDGIEFWSRQHIAFLMIKHAQVLPLAVSLRIGDARGAR